MTRTLVAVATYNEIDNLPRLVSRVFQMLPEAEVLVVDDNSPDGTGRWCDEYAAQDWRLSCRHRSAKEGLGTATLTALRHAIDRDYEYAITMDADLSHDPKYLPDLLSGMNPHGQAAMDVMIGSRYVAHGGIRGWPWPRRLMSRAINLYARRLLGLRVRDCSSAFRCYRTARLRELDFDRIRSRGFAVFEELLWHLQRAGARIGEIPIVFVDRDRGVSKINSLEALSAVRTMTQLGLQRLGTRRPRHAGPPETKR